MSACFDIYIFAMGHWIGLSLEIMKSPFPQVKITFFTLFYTYIILHSYVRPCKYIGLKFTRPCKIV
jgi:hypothetical protein